MRISEQIRQAIKTSGLTQYRIAKELGVAESTIGRFLAGGDIRTDLLDRLAELLGMTLIVNTPKATRELARTARRIHRGR